jgi:hypothetical protein
MKSMRMSQCLLQGFIRAACLIGTIGLFACQGVEPDAPITGGNTPPPSDGGTIPPVTGGSAPPTGTTLFNYKLTVTVSVPDSAADGGLAYNRLVVGAVADATDGFAHAGDSGYNLDSQQLWHDIRAGGLPQEWRVEVLAGTGRTVTLFWDAPAAEAGCGTYQVSLQDADGPLGQADLCAAGSMTYVGDGQLRHFVLRVS